MRFAAVVFPAVLIVTVQSLFFPMPVGLMAYGVLVGGLTALPAVAMALTYRSHRVLNLAQAEMGLLPVVVMAMLVLELGFPWWGGAIVALAVAGGLGALIETLILRRFRKSSRMLVMVVTLGLAQLLVGLSLLLPRFFGRSVLSQLAVPLPYQAAITIDGVRFEESALMTALVIPLAILGIWVFINSGTTGLAVRAIAQNPSRALSIGIPVQRLNTTIWVVSGVVTALAVYLRLGMIPGATITSAGLALLLRMVAAVLIGSMTNLVTIASTAIALGVLEVAISNATSHASMIDIALLITIIVALGGRQLFKRAVRRPEADTVSAWQATPASRPIDDAGAHPVMRAVTYGLLASTALVIVVLPQRLSAGDIYLVSTVLIYAVLCLSVVVLTGWTGQLSFGQMGFFIIGAVVAAGLAQHTPAGMMTALLAASAVGGAASLAVGWPLIRLPGLYLAVVTLAFAMATASFVVSPFLGDVQLVPQGRVERPLIFGWLSTESESSFYFLVVGVLVLLLVSLSGVRHSRSGRAMMATRDNPLAAEAFSLDPAKAKSMALLVSGALAGLAGALSVFAHRGFASWFTDPGENLTLFAAAIVGGVSLPIGAFIGALYQQGAQEFFSPQWRLVMTSFGLLGVLMLMPGGLTEAIVRLQSWVLTRVLSVRSSDKEQSEA